MISQSPPASPSSDKKTSSEIKEPCSPGGQSEEREPTPPPISADEEWVEYVDSFGRSRSCLRKDLPQFMKQDQQLEAKREERKKERNRWGTQYFLPGTCTCTVQLTSNLMLARTELARV